MPKLVAFAPLRIGLSRTGAAAWRLDIEGRSLFVPSRSGEEVLRPIQGFVSAFEERRDQRRGREVRPDAATQGD